MSFQIRTEEKAPRVFVVAVKGSIDASACREFQEQMDIVLGKRPHAVVLDFAGVDYVNSMALGIVFATKAALDKANAEFGISNLQPQVKAVFEIIKALPKQNVFSSVAEMDRYLAQIQKRVKSGQDD
ncbi:MAG: STAS domain-containing protein [Sedimentisphaerales bacterium]|nr:STAS domain-containing protein [Sedimentisphaerales bacterium]